MRKNSIFLCDDDFVFGLLISNFLKRHHFEVTYFVDGRQAVNQLRYDTPDMVISDILLPFHSGLEITQYIRKQLKSNIPVFLVSSLEGTESEGRAKSAGATSFLPKPLNPVNLLRLVDGQLRRTGITNNYTNH